MGDEGFRTPDILRVKQGVDDGATHDRIGSYLQFETWTLFQGLL